MIRPLERLWLFLACAVVTVLWPARSLYPRFWTRLFGDVLYGAAYVGSVRAVRLLLRLHADVEARETIARSTPLMAAATFDHLEVVRYLLARGADVNACNEYGVTALMRSAERSSVELTNLFLESGAEANARTQHGETAFIEAAKAGHTAVMQLLLDKDADMLAHNQSSMDALIWSTVLGQTHVVSFLLEHGINVAGKQGTRALRLAVHKKHAQIISLLRQAGAADSA